MDCVVHEVTKIQTRLSNFHSFTHSLTLLTPTKLSNSLKLRQFPNKNYPSQEREQHANLESPKAFGVNSTFLRFFFLGVFYFYFFYFFFNFTILVLPYINMNPPQVYTCSPS